jgi:glutamyl-tRNA reductase
MIVELLGISHKTAPVEVRERFAFAPDDLAPALYALRERMGNGVILSTCNRTEVYIASPARKGAGREALLEFAAQATGNGPGEEDRFYHRQGDDAVLHLFRVAAGIESMVLGEAEILGQVRSAYAAAAAAESNSPILDRLFHTAIRAGRRARTETHIARSPISVSSTAVKLAQKTLSRLEGATVLVVSAGQGGKLAARSLVDNGASRLLVTSRTFKRASALAADLGGSAIAFEHLPAAIAESDIVISSTGAPSFLIGPETVTEAMRHRNGRPLLFIDIAVPRDVDPAVRSLPNVHLYDIDDLKAVSAANLRRRGREVARVEAIVEEELVDFRRWRRALGVIPTVAELRRLAEEVRQAELARSMARLKGLSAEERRRIDSLTTAIVKKILHSPITRLKERGDDDRFVAATRDLFSLGGTSPEP